MQKDGTATDEQPPLNWFARSARTAVVPGSFFGSAGPSVDHDCSENGDRDDCRDDCDRGEAVLLAILLFLRPEDLAYGISDVSIDRASGAYAEGMELMMSIEGFMLMLAPIPVFTAINAILEYRHPVTSV